MLLLSLPLTASSRLHPPSLGNAFPQVRTGSCIPCLQPSRHPSISTLLSALTSPCCAPAARTPRPSRVLTAPRSLPAWLSLELPCPKVRSWASPQTRCLPAASWMATGTPLPTPASSTRWKPRCLSAPRSAQPAHCFCPAPWAAVLL